jgi:hypothetical protein
MNYNKRKNKNNGSKRLYFKIKNKNNKFKIYFNNMADHQMTKMLVKWSKNKSLNNKVESKV